VSAARARVSGGRSSAGRAETKGKLKRACRRRALRSASLSSGSAALAVAKESSEGKDGRLRRDDDEDAAGATPPAAAASDAFAPPPSAASSADASPSPPVGGDDAPESPARPPATGVGESGPESPSCASSASERLLATAPARGELMPSSDRSACSTGRRGRGESGADRAPEADAPASDMAAGRATPRGLALNDELSSLLRAVWSEADSQVRPAMSWVAARGLA